jgi:hypothetical protein
MLLRNPSETQTGPAIADDRNTVDVEWGSADAAAIKFGATHACTNALDDQGALQFGDRRDDDHDRATQRTVCVDRFALGKELNAEVVQFVEDLQEVLGGPGQAVARPDEDDIEAMPMGVLQEFV